MNCLQNSAIYCPDKISANGFWMILCSVGYFYTIEGCQLFSVSCPSHSVDCKGSQQDLLSSSERSSWINRWGFEVCNGQHVDQNQILHRMRERFCWFLLLLSVTYIKPLHDPQTSLIVPFSLLIQSENYAACLYFFTAVTGWWHESAISEVRGGVATNCVECN